MMLLAVADASFLTDFVNNVLSGVLANVFAVVLIGYLLSRHILPRFKEQQQDVEDIKDKLDPTTPGGITDVLEAVKATQPLEDR